MLTIFSTPKPFHGHSAIIQTNAIRNWLSLRPVCEVILFGDERGTAEVASELRIRHIPDVERNEYGTPLVSSMFSIAQNIASYGLIIYVNADIILMSDFLSAIRMVQKQPFLLVGRRWDIDLNAPMDFSNPDWEVRLRAYLAEVGTLHGLSGIDYLVFPRGMYRDIPSFAIGRPGWDNWMIYRARSMKVPVIDATKAITAIHQNHDYSHVPGGETTVWGGPERKRNIKLMDGKAFSLEYVTFFLTNQGLKPALTLRHLYFRMRAIAVLYPYFYFLLALFRVFEKTVRIVRLIKNIALSYLSSV